jgi:hypothetical protein
VVRNTRKSGGIGYMTHAEYAYIDDKHQMVLVLKNMEAVSISPA